jgi:carboxymethylenebutenolidase
MGVDQEGVVLDELTLSSGMRIWTSRPETSERRPAIVVLHGRRGPISVDGSWDRVEQLGRDGFVGCVPDLYHRFTGDRGPIEAQEARIDCTDAEYLADVDEAVDYLRSLPYVDPDRIGVAGFCMSGRIALSYAADRGPGAVALFHGGLYDATFAGQESAANFAARISCPVLGQFGELDPRVPMPNVRRFRNEMEEHGKSYEIRIFADTDHAWLNVHADAYRQAQAQEAWQTFLTFLEDVFAGRWKSERAIWRFGSDTSTAYDLQSLRQRSVGGGQSRLA